MDDRQINVLETQRKRALFSQDALAYFESCDDLGMDPEDQALYDKGQLESELNSAAIKTNENVNGNRYSSFYKRGNQLNTRSFDADVSGKRKLLRECFPGRFGKNGKQSLSRLDDLQIGALFERIMKYSEKRIRQ